MEASECTPFNRAVAPASKLASGIGMRTCQENMVVTTKASMSVLRVLWAPISLVGTEVLQFPSMAAMTAMAEAKQ